MIIVGYQGIGKSTLADNDMKYIDLESSNFFVNGKRADDWYIPYCKIAENLSSQGYNVFVSSHEVVRRELTGISSVDKMIVCPAPKLKYEWLKKLRIRYISTRLVSNEGEKNYKAYMNAYHRYDENIRELMGESGFAVRIITSMSYDLKEVIERGGQEE